MMRVLAGLSLLAHVFASPQPNVRERHTGALYISVPVSEADVAALLTPPLVPDTYGGHAWASLLVDDLDKLEYYVPRVGFVNTHTSGWMDKLNLFVRDPATGQRGYLITTIDFESGFTGFIRSKGAIATQKIPSSTGAYAVTQNATSVTASVRLDDAPKTHLQLSATLLPLETRDDNFVNFVTNRTTKYLQQFGGTVQCSLELGPGAQFSNNGTRVLAEDAQVSWSFLDRLKLRTIGGWSPCQARTCFLQPQYILVDHHNTVLPCPGDAGREQAS